MQIGEVCLLTNDVTHLANFYKSLFNIDNGSNDTVHQYIMMVLKKTIIIRILA